mgnify:CR=1 FL=1
MRRPAIALAFAVSMLASCQTPEPAGGPLKIEVAGNSGIAALQRINERAQTCWIRSGDKAFAGLAVIPELDTRVGKPRLLVLRKGRPAALPDLVIEAHDKPLKIETYGRLASGAQSARINGDVTRWATGQQSCQA